MQPINPVFDILRQYLPLLIPVLIIQIILLIVGLVDLFKSTTITRGPRWVWALVIIFINIIGPIIYFVVGRKEE
jgi:hypothetical protein